MRMAKKDIKALRLILDNLHDCHDLFSEAEKKQLPALYLTEAIDKLAAFIKVHAL